MRRIIEKTKKEKGLRIIYIVAFLLLLLSYAFTVFNNRELMKQATRVERTNTTIKHLDDILSRVKDAETGVRGYVVFRDIEFLSPYYGSHEAADSIYRLVVELSSDSELQQKRLRFLKENMDKRFAYLGEFIRAFNNNNRELTDSIRNLQAPVKGIMDNIRVVVSVMQQEENRLLAERNDRMKKTFNLVNIITAISIILAISLLLFSTVAYTRTSKAMDKIMLEIGDYQEQLKDRIEQLNKANAELVKMRSQEKFAATGRIARTIAHEVRNPLTNINLAADQLRTESNQKDENAAFLFDMITRNSTRINQLVADLLNSTKVPELNFEKIPVSNLLDEALQDAADRITLGKTQVVKNYTADLCVSVDKAKMKIAFLNIIINALEAMENRENSVLTLETRRENDKCKIAFSDNGAGMETEALNRVFEPYFTSKLKGNGLGLTNTQNIILNHHGEISAESAMGKGTSFIIILNIAG